ncbi:hypothetical protein PFICI_00215 [Pestalotiopsis fici W106-1]|uniref:Uncharacterized protein n=1 Tax=Pestalotiopsis fici (strain W106-1 / CGMCC3.15140) TaxID=1229662 RepID=W3XLP6_PESFW|nr:uncharacterized protein PFICI_00215 [Pestalotiopsis fici W106-1]ETS86387.1 hypothetical protein PFICI_00215 [Pestalotiopsis fici W106-1]
MLAPGEGGPNYLSLARRKQAILNGLKEEDEEEEKKQKQKEEEEKKKKEEEEKKKKEEEEKKKKEEEEEEKKKKEEEEEEERKKQEEEKKRQEEEKKREEERRKKEEAEKLAKQNPGFTSTQSQPTFRVEIPVPKRDPARLAGPPEPGTTHTPRTILNSLLRQTMERDEELERRRLRAEAGIPETEPMPPPGHAAWEAYKLRVGWVSDNPWPEPKWSRLDTIKMLAEREAEARARSKKKGSGGAAAGVDEWPIVLDLPSVTTLRTAKGGWLQSRVPGLFGVSTLGLNRCCFVLFIVLYLVLSIFVAELSWQAFRHFVLKKIL